MSKFLSSPRFFCHLILVFGSIFSAFANDLSDVEEEKFIIGSCTTHINYTLIPSKILNESVWVQLICPKVIESEETIHQLMQYAVCFEANTVKNKDIILNISELNLPLDYGQLWEFNEDASLVGFYLENQTQLPQAIQLLKDICFHSTLSDQSIEQARFHLLNLDEESNRLIGTIEAKKIKDYYANWLQQNKTLFIFGDIQLYQTCEDIEEIFEQGSVYQEIGKSELIQKASPFLHVIREELDHTLIIDEKIWMNKPKPFQMQVEGKRKAVMISFFCVIVLGIWINFMSLFITLLPFLASGFLFFGSYMNDPEYVEHLRQIDLTQGMIKAYHKGRLQMTLTPLERRVSFLNQVINHPKNLEKEAILILVDEFKLNDPTITQMFTSEEYERLKQIRRQALEKFNPDRLKLHNLNEELDRKCFYARLANSKADSNYIRALCKISMNYESRLNVIQNDLKLLVTAQNKELMEQVHLFPIHLDLIEDYIDLRVQK